MIVIAAIAMIGLVWLSIALAGWLSSLIAPSLAAAIIGGSFAGIAALAYAVARMARHNPKSASKQSDTVSDKNADLISRATSMAERLAPDSPIIALIIALVAGIASVHLPDSMSPFLKRVLDDVEKKPNGRLNS